MATAHRRLLKCWKLKFKTAKLPNKALLLMCTKFTWTNFNIKSDRHVIFSVSHYPFKVYQVVHQLLTYWLLYCRLYAIVTCVRPYFFHFRNNFEFLSGRAASFFRCRFKIEKEWRAAKRAFIGMVCFIALYSAWSLNLSVRTNVEKQKA